MKQDTARKFEDALTIDNDALDECIAEQPPLVWHIAEGLRKASYARDLLKLELDDLCAERDQQLRREADENAEKVTEKIIEMRLRLLPEIKGLNRKVFDAKAEVDRWLSIEKAYDARSYSLGQLTRLKTSELQALMTEHGMGSSQAALRNERVEAFRRSRT